jgi:hypothetical protein
MADEELKENLNKAGVPKNVINRAQSHLQKGGVSLDKVDLESDYDSSLSPRENQANIESKYPVESMERRVGNYSERQQLLIEKETDMELTRQEKEALEEEYMENPNYEKAGRLTQVREKLSRLNRQLGRKEYLEPNNSNEINVSAQELGIGEVGSIRRKQGAFERTKEAIGGAAEWVGGELKNYQEKSKENRIKRIGEQEHSLALDIREHRIKTLRERIRGGGSPSSGGAHPTSMFGSQSSSGFGSFMLGGNRRAGSRPSSVVSPLMGAESSSQTVPKERIVTINGRTHKYIEMVKVKQRTGDNFMMGGGNSKAPAWLSGGNSKAPAWLEGKRKGKKYKAFDF